MTRSNAFSVKRWFIGRGFIRISLSFIGLVVLFNLVVNLLSNAGYLGFLTRFTTVAAARLINVFGYGATVSGSNILLPHRVFEITLECTAIYIAFMYASLVIAYPVEVKTKLVGLAIGIPSIIVTNLIRLLVIAAISEGLPRYFDLAHDYLWQVAFVLIVTGPWFLIVVRGSKGEQKGTIRH